MTNEVGAHPERGSTRTAELVFVDLMTGLKPQVCAIDKLSVPYAGTFESSVEIVGKRVCIAEFVPRPTYFDRFEVQQRIRIQDGLTGRDIWQHRHHGDMPPGSQPCVPHWEQFGLPDIPDGPVPRAVPFESIEDYQLRDFRFLQDGTLICRNGKSILAFRTGLKGPTEGSSCESVKVSFNIPESVQLLVSRQVGWRPRHSRKEITSCQPRSAVRTAAPS